MIPHLASSVISTVKTNLIKWETRVIDHENQQISVQNRLRKLKGNELTRLSQRKRYGNTKQCVHFHLRRFPSKPPCGNATEFWTIRFPQHFRIAETPHFTPCNHRISFHARRKLWAWECLHLCFQIWPNIHRHGLSQLARQVCQWRGQSQSGKTGPFYDKLRKQRPSVWLLCACPTRRALAGRAVTFE